MSTIERRTEDLAKAAKAVVKHEQFPEPGYGWRCQHCKRVKIMGHQDACLVGKLKDALASMEGTR